MKIQCDVCSVAEASVFCCADEAALCDPCDRRVHRANNLAGKHRRFSLLHPSSSSSRPLCDVCQERRGFVFCQEDRAILCRDCDALIHTATTLTMKHSRFLLTGVSLSSAPIPPAPPKTEVVVASQKNKGNKQAMPVSSSSSEAVCSTAAATAPNGSSISEYLIKMLPGWHVEDFLTDDSAAGDNFFQVDEAMPFLEPEDFPSWLPRVPPADHPVPASAAGGDFHQSRRRSEDAFAVPQILIERGSKKRSRPPLWSF